MLQLSALRSDDRVLVSGASGWIGRSLLSVLLPVADRMGAQVLATGSVARSIAMDGSTVRIVAWTDDVSAEWAPTVVVHCAFATRDRLESLGAAAFEAANLELTQRGIFAFSLPSVRAGVQVSSGAAVAADPDLYGRMKQAQERAFRDVARDAERPLVTARIWSVSGPHCTKPDGFAFSSFIAQALRSRTIEVTALGEIWRRYVDAAQYMSIALEHALGGASAVVDSTGDLVELHGLAESVASALGAKVVAAPASAEVPADRYYSSSPQMTELSQAQGVRLMNLQEQIQHTARGLQA